MARTRSSTYLFQLVRDRRPDVTLEIGFAYGLSTLFIAEALRQNGRGRHVVIDPNEHRRFDGLGLRHLEEAGLAEIVTFLEEPAELCLPRLAEQNLRVDLAFNDSDHLFDHVVTEFVLLGFLLPKGALLVFDDASLPGVGRACDFIAANRPDFAEVRESPRRLFDRDRVPPPPPSPRGSPSMRVFRRVLEEDPRDWKDYTPF
ncbi:MAG: class I SAM-dependent methyltransferase [Deltaproteobacteria bacterium]|nr:MAG: class I SAM-dependent methyltransferase [Deltaproteobacteria bacterium]